jgi:saccharopine dehydrogenase-like NADP-dependent oxidoreductase
MTLKTILLFGAGKSATVLIDYLIKEAEANNWNIVVADADLQLALLKTKSRKFSEAAQLDINDHTKRKELISGSDLVISMMPPALHILIANDCIEFGKSLLTASYADDAIKSLETAVKEKGILFLCEMGLDPGIDHMSAIQILDEIKDKGGKITSFKSHCGGLVAPESDNNPWRYKISWNPRNVVLAGKAGAIYKNEGKIVEEKYEQLFHGNRTVILEAENNATFSYYPNRNSLSYIDLYQLPEVETFVRTTLRYEDFMKGWSNMIELHLTDETPAYDTDGLSLQDFYKQHFSKYGFNKWLDEKLTQQFSGVDESLEELTKLIGTAKSNEDLEALKSDATQMVAQKMIAANLILKQLFFLGLHDTETIINKGFCSAADVLQFILEKKLALQSGDKDMVVMLHEIEYLLNDKKQLIKSSLLVKGDDELHTAMAKTVGLPLGIAAKLILNGTINLSGIHIPISKEIYNPVLNELKKYGVVFKERVDWLIS